MNKETNIDCMKYRKSTHLAGIDVETIIAEKGQCILTIKEAYFERNVDVSGNKTDGYFLTFVEDVKPMVANSGNRKIISNIVKNEKNLSSTDSRNIGNWAGTALKLIFDPAVKMMGSIVGGIKIHVDPPVKMSDVNALKLLSASKTIDELTSNWGKLTPAEKNLPTVLAKKDSLKTQLK